MTDEELGRLSTWLRTIAEMRQFPPPSPRVCAVFARLLGPYPYELVDKAILAHLASPAAGYRTPLQPAHILEQIQRIQPTALQAAGDSASPSCPPVPKLEARSYLQMLRARLAHPLPQHDIQSPSEELIHGAPGKPANGHRRHRAIESQGADRQTAPSAADN